jgi:hypothetical protein
MLMVVAILSGLSAVSLPAEGQDIKNARQAEDTLAVILGRLNNAGNDSVREVISQSFYQTLMKALMLPDADDCTFASLKTLIKISPDDNKFRIFHWNLPAGNGKNRFYGFLKLLHQKTPVVFPLHDFSDSIPSPSTAVLDQDHWFGALYYTVITGKSASGKTYYTLLGWAGTNSVTTRKVIEVLWFDEHDIPRFGFPVFPDYEGGNMTRVIFRYSASTSMSLKYEEQVISAEKKWNPKKREFEVKTRTGLVIVCDHLVPLDPQLEGQYQYYVAAGELFDAFQPVNGSWHFIREMELHNKR